MAGESEALQDKAHLKILRWEGGACRNSAGPSPRVSDSVSPGICIFNMFPGHVEAVDTETTVLRVHGAVSGDAGRLCGSWAPPSHPPTRDLNRAALLFSVV